MALLIPPIYLLFSSYLLNFTLNFIVSSLENPLTEEWHHFSQTICTTFTFILLKFFLLGITPGFYEALRRMPLEQQAQEPDGTNFTPVTRIGIFGSRIAENQIAHHNLFTAPPGHMPQEESPHRS